MLILLLACIDTVFIIVFIWWTMLMYCQLMWALFLLVDTTLTLTIGYGHTVLPTRFVVGGSTTCSLPVLAVCYVWMISPMHLQCGCFGQRECLQWGTAKSTRMSAARRNLVLVVGHPLGKAATAPRVRRQAQIAIEPLLVQLKGNDRRLNGQLSAGQGHYTSLREIDSHECKGALSFETFTAVWWCVRGSDGLLWSLLKYQIYILQIGAQLDCVLFRSYATLSVFHFVYLH